MRKTFILMFLIISCVALICGSAYALSGVCSNCHTMHYSQNGTILSDWETGGPFGYLLLASCIGCHTGPSVPTNTHGAPVVLRTGDPGGQGVNQVLAGGDFWWVHQGGAANDPKGHNVQGLANVDNLIGGGAAGYTPPGWDPAATPGALGDGTIAGGAANWGTNQLKCAGNYGCHGRHLSTLVSADAGIFGSHHSNTGGTETQATSPTTVGNSYRFLGGIKGLEHSDWNYNATSSIHNEYSGVNSPNNRQDPTSTTYANRDTISYSCAECHGFFHSRISSTATGQSPWLRHPTDIALPGDATKEYTNYTAYSNEAPVARPDLTSIPDHSAVVPGTDIVMCLSCHRAHGSPESDILRWTYSTMQAGSGTSDTGCFTCHTHKNAN